MEYVISFLLEYIKIQIESSKKARFKKYQHKFST